MSVYFRAEARAARATRTAGRLAVAAEAAAVLPLRTVAPRARPPLLRTYHPPRTTITTTIRIQHTVT